MFLDCLTKTMATLSKVKVEGYKSHIWIKSRWKTGNARQKKPQQINKYENGQKHNYRLKTKHEIENQMLSKNWTTKRKKKKQDEVLSNLDDFFL